jgi:cobalt transport protein ATP-binding subunit
MPVLEVDNVFFCYPGTDEPALCGLTLEVGQGEILFLLGTNGSGKTTLLLHLNGLLRPARGSVRLGGIPLHKVPDRELFSTVGLVFQDPNDQLFAPTVGEDVLFGPRNLGVPEDEALERQKTIMDTVGLSGFESRPVRSLSYGQKKRAALAGALVMNPRVLLLDEPTAGIDPLGAMRIMALTRELNLKEGLTVVVATHDVDLAAVFAQKVCLLAGGRVVKMGEAGDVLSDPAAMRAASLRLPRIAHLAEVMGHRDGLESDSLPLTISQARSWIKRQLAGKRENGGE